MCIRDSHYHYDGHDSLIAATAGVKIWTVCDPDWEFARSAVVQTIVGMGLSCQNITLQAGDTLYIPEGSYHKAWPTSSGLASLHLTIAIDTSMQSWQRFLLLVLERGSEAPCDGLAEHIEEAVATKQYHWRKTGPFASSTAMRMSVHNNDLPKGYIERIVVPAVSQEIAVLLSKQHSTECVTAVGSKLLRLPESLRHAVGEALDTLRLDWAGKSRSVPLELRDRAVGMHSTLLRTADSRCALVTINGQRIFAVRNHGVPVGEDEFKLMEWCLRWHRGSGTREFVVSDMPGDDGLKLRVARELVLRGMLTHAVDSNAERVQSEL
eukprot:TRINITY_DN13866_c0_g1_i3.p1 TRINITY_DN13866_c0_g1~~TRINITY_DN13866_c0_g1_i3.p1  ORF type:complete len:323 (+),score=38.24 TRINITY_DN13866_c0_g1_i3:70-1038(+)